ncbi:hypothetical protein GW17_00014670, partial [Ensete ventricosum]
LQEKRVDYCSSHFVTSNNPASQLGKQSNKKHRVDRVIYDFDISVAALPIVKRSTVFNTKAFIKSHRKAVAVPYPNLLFHLREKDTPNPNRE